MFQRMYATLLAFAAGLAPATAGAQMYGYQPGWGSGSWGLGHMAIGGLLLVLFWGTVIVLVVLAVRWLGGGAHQPPGARRAALDILEERFARGEIDKDEFEERRRLLGR
jgi:putative membrane protein